MQAREIGREAQGRWLVRGVSFSLSRGDVLAIVGPSGSGKTSLLRVLNRLDEPTEGTVYLEGKDYRDIHPRILRRRMGLVSQQPFLFPGTIGDNLRYGPTAHGSVPEKEELDALLSAVALPEHQDRDTETLSGGEAQRVALARALANRPEVLLLDEPTSSLDGAARDEVEKLIQSIIRDRGLTCILVTHDEDQARRLAGHVALIDRGRLCRIGSAREVLGA